MTLDDNPLTVEFFYFYFSSDPSINLNFSIFLYNTGEKKDAAKQFNIYERKMESYRSVKGVEIDAEVNLPSHIFNPFAFSILFSIHLPRGCQGEIV